MLTRVSAVVAGCLLWFLFWSESQLSCDCRTGQFACQFEEHYFQSSLHVSYPFVSRSVALQPALLTQLLCDDLESGLVLAWHGRLAHDFIGETLMPLLKEFH